MLSAHPEVHGAERFRYDRAIVARGSAFVPGTARADKGAEAQGSDGALAGRYLREIASLERLGASSTDAAEFSSICFISLMFPRLDHLAKREPMDS